MHLNGISSQVVDSLLGINFILSDGHCSELPLEAEPIFFRGEPHVVCSYACYSAIGSIEIYEKYQTEGKLCVGIKFNARDGEVLAQAFVSHEQQERAVH